jgi:hypothetical protein
MLREQSEKGSRAGARPATAHSVYLAGAPRLRCSALSGIQVFRRRNVACRMPKKLDSRQEHAGMTVGEHAGMTYYRGAGFKARVRFGSRKGVSQ